MSSTSLSAQRVRLKQVPIDEWSTREKLALASSVARSGDQNWYSVSRPLKAYGEVSRPVDWFSQKNCALQYSDLLEKVETPKRKRGERGEDIAEDVIVRKLTSERIEELKKLIENERESCRNIRQEAEKIKSGEASDEFLRGIWQRMEEQKKCKELETIEHANWLKEREAKYTAAKLLRHGLLSSKIPKQETIQPIEPPTTIAPSPGIKSKTEPLTIHTEGQTPKQSSLSINIPGITPPTAPETPILHEKKFGLTPVKSPSTSPLLTSLLQSPTPISSSSLASPKSGNNNSQSLDGIRSPQQLKQQQQNFFSPSSSMASTTAIRHFTGITSPKRSTEELNLPAPEALEGPKSPIKSPAPPPPPLSSTSEARPPTPTLSLPPETQEQEKVTQQTSPQVIEEGEQTIDEPTKEIIDEIAEEEALIEETPVEISPKPSPKKVTRIHGKEKSIAYLREARKEIEAIKNEIMESDSGTFDTTIAGSSGGGDSITNKQEHIDSKDTSDENTLDDTSSNSKLDLTQEAVDENRDIKTPNVTKFSTRGKRKRMAMTITPRSVTRRSGRFRTGSDSKFPNDEDSGNQSETPTGSSGGLGKKVQIAEEVTDASMSEESMDALTKRPIIESVPNSPSSSTMHSEDAESLREYKLWKKSIMLLWRQAATHKFSSLFLHPVTDDEAKGYSTVVYRPVDLTSIRKRIESGTLRTTAEFQRDIFLLFQNAIMYNSTDHDVHQMAVEMQKEILDGVEDFIETQQQQSGLTIPTPSRGRRSAISATPVTESRQQEQQQDGSIASRRKSRTSTDTDPGTQSISKFKAKKEKKQQ